MKICYLCADLGIPIGGNKGGAAYVRGLIKAWTRLGHEVLLITPPSRLNKSIGVPVVSIPQSRILDSLLKDAQKRIENNPKSENWQRARLIRALGHVWNNVSIEKVVRKTLKNFKPDLFYERYSPFSVAGGVVAKQLKIPHGLGVNAPLAWEGAKYRKQALPEAAETLEHIAFENSSLIITTCRELKDDLKKVGVPNSKIKIVPCGADPELFSPEGEKYRPDSTGQIVIGFVGSLKLWHGLEILIEAFKEIANDPRFHLLVIGEGPMMDELVKLKETLPRQVTLMGAVSQHEVPKYVRGMDIAVAPYPVLERFYFSPLKILEYMASGCAVIASRIGQIPELIRDGETGILVSPGNIQELIQAIKNLANNPETRNKLGKSAAEDIQQNHTWTHRARRILSLADQYGLTKTLQKSQ